MGVPKKIRKKTTNEVTVQELFELFQVEKRTLGVEEKTIRNYRESLKRFLLSYAMDNSLFFHNVKDKITHEDAKGAACSTQGNIEYWHCDVCGRNFDNASETHGIINDIDLTIPEKGHTWSEWTTVSKAAVFDAELQRRVCSVCGAEESRKFGTVLKPSIKMNTTSVVLKVKQSTNKITVDGLAKGVYVKSAFQKM